MQAAVLPTRRLAAPLALSALLMLMSACAAFRAPPPVERTPPPPTMPRDIPDARAPEISREVTASAYNSLREQTGPTPTVAAWGDRLEPGMRAIAVSRDLIEVGLTHGTRVTIEGLEGEYVVLDKMHSRWTNKIDIYMGEDVGAARRWGVREVRIRWSPPAE